MGLAPSTQDKAEQLEQLLAAAVTPTTGTLSVTSGTAVQDGLALPSDVYIPLTSTGSGTYTIAIGSTNAASTVLCTTLALASGVTQIAHVRLPANWYLKVTVANVTIGTVTQVAGG